MLHTLTATASILTAALVFQFVTGLVQLWQQSTATTPAAAPAPQLPPVSDPWDGESWEPSLAFPIPAPTQRPMLLLAPAPVGEAFNTPPVSEYFAEYASATLASQTIRQLKALAKERGLKKYSYLTKAELMTALM